MDLFKEVLPSLLKNSNNHLVNTVDEEKQYVPFVVNKALSQHIDCIFYVNEMNKNHHIDNRMQYDYYFYSLRRYNRQYQKWFKNKNSDDLELVKEYYGYSTIKAKQVLEILSDEEIKYIKKRMDKGGISTKAK